MKRGHKVFLSYLISRFHCRALRAVYNNHKSSFDDVIEKGNSLKIPELHSGMALKQHLLLVLEYKMKDNPNKFILLRL